MCSDLMITSFVFGSRNCTTLNGNIYLFIITHATFILRNTHVSDIAKSYALNKIIKSQYIIKLYTYHEFVFTFYYVT